MAQVEGLLWRQVGKESTCWIERPAGVVRRHVACPVKGAGPRRRERVEASASTWLDAVAALVRLRNLARRNPPSP
jgi:hypothetical protein